MGRHNRRRKNRWSEQTAWQDVEQNFQRLQHPPEQYEGRCAFCGRLLHPGDWQMQRDEHGQNVRACRDLNACIRRCRRRNYLSLMRSIRIYGRQMRN